jgi:platelet-activating factor acetylhydrolase IB subunit alpha
MVLTEKQQEELLEAVLEWLCSNPRWAAASAALAAAAGRAVPAPAPGSAALERKWTTVVRLNKRVLELEAKVAEGEAERKQLVAAGAGAAALTQGAGAVAKSAETYLLKTSARQRLSGHRGAVTAVAFHPRFSLLVSCSEDATCKVWESESGELERTLKGHTNAVCDCAFNDDGSTLATCSSDLSVKLWEFAGKNAYECRRTLLGHDHSVTGVQFLKGGAQLVSCSRDASIKLWDASSGYCLRTLTGHDEWVRKVDVHLDLCASCSSDKTVMVWNLQAAGGAEPRLATLRGHEHVVECVAFSSATADKALGAAAASAGAASAGAVDEAAAAAIVAAAQQRQGGLHVVSGSRDKTIRVWQVASAQCVAVLAGHDNWVRAIRFQPRGKYVISVAEDKSLRLWDLAQQRCVRTVANAHAHFLTALAVHPSLALVATGGVDQDVALWQAAPSFAD